MVEPERVRLLLEAVAAGRIDPVTAAREISPAPAGQPGSLPPVADAVRVDLGRVSRCGFPEVVYGPGKSPSLVVEVFERLTAAGQACLATRVDAGQVTAVRARFPDVIHQEAARTLRRPAAAFVPPAGRVAVVTAGSSDLPVALEAVETLHWMGCLPELIVDVGVAGPQRLLAVVPQLQQMNALVVVAGMEGALPSVVAGHVAVPVFAVPTSVGYGASFGGLAALLAMLNSCAASVAVVNIDAGFKAAWLAGMVARATAAAAAVAATS